jgi:hypothetical protein
MTNTEQFVVRKCTSKQSQHHTRIVKGDVLRGSLHDSSRIDEFVKARHNGVWK